MPFRLLDLPGELREKVCSHALVLPNPLVLRPVKRQNGRFDLSMVRLNGGSQDRPSIDLILCNKQIYQEALPVLYSWNVFEIDEDFVDEAASLRGLESKSTPELTYLALSSFLNGIGKQNASLIRHLCVSFPSLAMIDEFLKRPLDVINPTSITAMQLVHARCTGLETLELLPEAAFLAEAKLTFGLKEAELYDLLHQLDNVLRDGSTASLKRIVIRFAPPKKGFINLDRDEVRWRMAKIGWVVTEVTVS